MKKSDRVITILFVMISISFTLGFLTGSAFVKPKVIGEIKEVPITVSQPIPEQIHNDVIIEPEWQTFIATAYCPCAKCCGEDDGITASGYIAQEGITIAADWDILPKETIVEIDTLGERMVQDKGQAIKGNRIDIFMSNHQAAVDFGIKELRVRIKSERDDLNG